MPCASEIVSRCIILNSQELNLKRIDELIRFILSVASHEDGWARKLGPIHIIKYVYLADLAYATYYEGATYTGINWTFYHYGPWAYPLYERIPEALNVPYIIKESFDSSFDSDYTRWSVKFGSQHLDLEKNIPLVISGHIGKYVSEFNSSTYDLLHYVYKTKPMLQAAPNEILDFQLAARNIMAHEKESVAELTTRQKKKKKERTEEYRKKIQESLKNKKKKLIFTKPNYDEVFDKGVEWLESLAGEEIKPVKGTLHFSNDIWKSEARRDPDDI